LGIGSAFPPIVENTIQLKKSNLLIIAKSLHDEIPSHSQYRIQFDPNSLIDTNPICPYKNSMISKTIPLTVAMMIGFHPVSSMAQGTSGPTISEIIEAHEDAVEVLYEKMRGKSREEQQKLYKAEYPIPDQAIESITALVTANPGGPASLDGIDWLLRYSGQKGLDPALYDALETHHLHSEKLQAIVLKMARSRTPETQKFLTKVSEKSKIKDVRGAAILSLMKRIERDKEKEDEHTALSKKLFAEHPDLIINGRNVTKSIKAKREAGEKLAIGKVAPEIIGKDVDGNEMKLSDYRGKIVVLDFWGDW